MYAGPLAKSLLAVVVAGGDPTAFGGHDLVAELQALETTQGRFSDQSAYGDYSNTIGQSLAVIALARAGQGINVGSVEQLLGRQCADGGFSGSLDTADGCVSDPDATAFAVQALLAAGASTFCNGDLEGLTTRAGAAAAAGLDRLDAIQGASGGFTSADGAVNANTTGVAAQALTAGGRTTAAGDAVAFIKGLQYVDTTTPALLGGIAFSAQTRSTTVPTRLRPARHPSGRARYGRRLPRDRGRARCRGCRSHHHVPARPDAPARRRAADHDGHPHHQPHDNRPSHLQRWLDPGRRRLRGLRPVDHRRRHRSHRLARADRHGGPGAGAAGPAARARRRPRGLVQLTPPGGTRLMAPSTSRLVARLAGAAAASGLALAGLVVAAAPASAAACSGSTGVTVVVDTGGSISTRCASGDPGSALSALKAAGFSVEYPQQFPGSVVCRINGSPSSDPCVRMPPSSAYWAFFHAKRGGSWVYSSSGVASYNPAPGSVVGFRFGSGQQPGIAPPAATKTSAPAPTKTTPKPTSKPKPPTTKPKPATRSHPQGHLGVEHGRRPRPPTAPPAKRKGARAHAPHRPPRPSASATASASASGSASGTPTASPSETASDLAAAPTSTDAKDDSNGPGTLLAGSALVALVAGGAGFAAWKRRS